jgi:hypothetical protein
MTGENPIAALTSVVAIFGYAIVQLATEPLNPGHPSFAMILAFLGASIGAVWELGVTASEREVEDRAARVRDRAFWFSLAAGWVGILVYVGCLLATFL